MRSRVSRKSEYIQQMPFSFKSWPLQVILALETHWSSRTYCENPKARGQSTVVLWRPLCLVAFLDMFTCCRTNQCTNRRQNRSLWNKSRPNIFSQWAVEWLHTLYLVSSVLLVWDTDSSRRKFGIPFSVEAMLTFVLQLRIHYIPCSLYIYLVGQWRSLYSTKVTTQSILLRFVRL